MYITQTRWERIFPNFKDSNEWVDICNDILPKWNIDTPLRVSMFLAQVAHESGNFRFLKENLNYSEKGLKTVFGKYFPGDLATQYARKPEKIANRVYANRMGNGPEVSGDGWNYRGRGLIQLTGKNNYTNFALDIQLSMEDTINYLETKEGAMVSACWFWKTNKINQFADKDDIKGSTRRINGGFNGLQHRTEMYQKAKIILNAKV
jgi:putative chitinase